MSPTKMRELRRERGHSIDHVANLIGVPSPFYRVIESGELKAPIPLAAVICVALGASEAELFPDAMELLKHRGKKRLQKPL